MAPRPQIVLDLCVVYFAILGGFNGADEVRKRPQLGLKELGGKARPEAHS